MKKKKKRKRNFRAKNDKHARYTLRKFTSAPLRNSISIPIANIGIGAFEARSMIPKEKERATFDDKIEGNVDTPFFFFFFLSRHFSLPFFLPFFFLLFVLGLHNDSHEIKRESTGGAKLVGGLGM